MYNNQYFEEVLNKYTVHFEVYCYELTVDIT